MTGTARHAVWLQRHRPAMAPARPDGFGRAEHVAVFCEPRRHRAGRMARQFLDRRRGLGEGRGAEDRVQSEQEIGTKRVEPRAQQIGRASCRERV